MEFFESRKRKKNFSENFTLSETMFEMLGGSRRDMSCPDIVNELLKTFEVENVDLFSIEIEKNVKLRAKKSRLH